MTTADTIARISAIKALDGLPKNAVTLIDALTVDLLRSTRNGKRSSAAAIIARMIKANKKRFNDQNALSYSWIDSAGRQCTCDGYRAYRMHQHMPLPEIPDNIKPLDLDKIFPAGGGRVGNPSVPTPDRADVKAFIDLQRSEFKSADLVYHFGPGLPVVNAAYLLEMLDVLPDAKIYLSESGNLTSPIYFAGTAGDAVLLPIRMGNLDKCDLEKHARIRLNQAIAADPDRPEIDLDDLALLTA